LFICGGYIVIVVLTYLYHISYLSESGFCVIGIHRKVSFALSGYEMAINVYLTSLFLYPLRNIYSYKTHTTPHLRQMTTRCIFGMLGTLTSTGANLFAISALDGEPAWLCLLCCNLDLLFCVLIVHYVTSFRSDKELSTEPTPVFPKAGHSSCITTSIVHDEQNRVNDPRGITVSVEHSQQFDEIDEEAGGSAEGGAEKAADQPEENGESMYMPKQAPARTAQGVPCDPWASKRPSPHGLPAETPQGQVRPPSNVFARVMWYLE